MNNVCGACEQPIVGAMLYQWCDYQDCREHVCYRCFNTGPLDPNAQYAVCLREGLTVTSCRKHQGPVERFMDTKPTHIIISNLLIDEMGSSL
jgi:hypothetical protein